VTSRRLYRDPQILPRPDDSSSRRGFPLRNDATQEPSSRHTLLGTKSKEMRVLLRL
jgi:hypothetical protein